jgi:hypothetical protein
MAVMAPDYVDEVALPFIPRRVQRALLAAHAPAGRALGYRAFDSRYGPRLSG